MKKMYEKTVRGYYVMSVVLGLLLALSVATMLEVTMLDVIWSLEKSDPMVKFWQSVAVRLPLLLSSYFWWWGISYRSLATLAVTASILAVGIFVRMSGTKGSRTKMLQAIATAIFALLLMLAYDYATRGRRAFLAVVPILLMVIPLTILRKTQQPVDGAKVAERTYELWARVQHIAREHRTITVAVISLAALVVCVGAIMAFRFYYQLIFR